MPLWRAPGSVCAKTRMTSAWQPFEIQNLLPFSTQPPSLRTAVSSIAAGSDPTFGSERAKAPIVFAAKRSGSQRFRCSSVPNCVDRRADQRELHRERRREHGRAGAADRLAEQHVGDVVDAARRRTPPGTGPPSRPLSASLRMISSGNDLVVGALADVRA